MTTPWSFGLIFRMRRGGKTFRASHPFALAGRLSVRPSVRPSVLAVRPSGCSSVRPSVRLFVCLSVRPSVRPSGPPSVCPSVRHLSEINAGYLLRITHLIAA